MSDWSHFPCLSGVLHCRIGSLNRQDTPEFWSCGVCSSCKGIVTLENSSFWMGAVPIFASEIKVTNCRARCEFLPPAFTLQSSSWALLANGVANPILKASRPFTLYFPANIWKIIIWSSWQSFIFFFLVGLYLGVLKVTRVKRKVLVPLVLLLQYKRKLL